MRYATAIGTYYRILGWLSLTGLLVGLALIYWTDHLFLDFSFILWFSLGSGLKRRSRTARKWAIGLSAFVSVLLAAFLLSGSGSAHFGSAAFAAPDIRYYLTLAGLFLLLGLPGLLLLSRRAKREFDAPPDALPPEATDSPASPATADGQPIEQG